MAEMVSRTVIVRGSFSDETFADLTWWAGEHGLDAYEVTSRYQLGVAPVWTAEEAERITLTDAVIRQNWHPGTTKAFAAFLGRMQIRSIADLGRLSFGRFAEPTRSWTQNYDAHVRRAVLEFMIKNGLRFTDLEPAVFFATPIDTEDLFTPRARDCLVRSSLSWLEVLQFVTETELWEIEDFGQKSIDAVKLRLAQAGLQLKNG